VILLASTFEKFCTGMSSCCAATSIVPNDAPIFRFSTAPPVPVTTTCCNSTAEAPRLKSRRAVSLATIVIVATSGR
jgi:hypothetical protein